MPNAQVPNIDRAKVIQTLSMFKKIHTLVLDVELAQGIESFLCPPDLYDHFGSGVYLETAQLIMLNSPSLRRFSFAVFVDPLIYGRRKICPCFIKNQDGAVALEGFNLFSTDSWKDGLYDDA